MPDTCRTSAFYVAPDGLDSGGNVVFDAGESTHIARVLRLRPGRKVEVLDGRGGIYRVELTDVGSNRVVGRVTESRTEPERLPAVSAAVALGRKERLRFAVEKLAELGCRTFWPLDCENLQFPGKLGSLTARLQSAAVAALKQSRQPYLTTVAQPRNLKGLLADCRERGQYPVLCQPGEGESVTLRDWAAGADRNGEYVLVVGPEGGFSAREEEAIAESGYPCLSLGNHWLRSETAAIAGVALLIECLHGECSVSGGNK